MSKLETLVDQLSGLTVLEAAELSKLLEEKWGVSAAAPVAMAGAGPAAAGPAEPVEEQTEFTVMLTGAGGALATAIAQELDDAGAQMVLVGRGESLQRACEIQLATLSMGTPLVVDQAVIDVHQRDLYMAQASVRPGEADFAAMVRKVDKIDTSWRD